MKKDTMISSIELFMILMGFIFGSTAIMNPASAAKQDAWLAYLIGWAAGAVLIGIYIWVAKLNPSQNLIEILQGNFGKILGNIIAILYMWYFIHLASLVFRNFGEFMVTVSYTETPMLVFIVCLAGLVCYGVICGIEVIGRIADVLVPLIPIVVFFLFLSLITHSDVSAFLPVLENGMGGVIQTSFTVMSFPFGECVVFLMIFPFLNKKSNLSRSVFSSFAFTGFLLFAALVRDMVILGPHLISEINYTGHAVARLIPGISVEPMLDLNFLIGGGIKISILIFSASLGVTQIFNLDDYKPFVTAITTFAVLLSIWVYHDIMSMFRWASDIYPYYAFPFQVIFPVLILIISIIKRIIKNEKTSSQ